MQNYYRHFYFGCISTPFKVLDVNIIIVRALDYRGIPFEVAIPTQDHSTVRAVRPTFKYGSMSGMIRMSDDFNEPID